MTGLCIDCVPHGALVECRGKIFGGSSPLFECGLLSGSYSCCHFCQVERQALSRVHRLGQTKAVYVKRLVALGTVEDEILKIQERKLRLAQDALSPGTEGGGNKLTEDDLRCFFSH